MPGDTVMTDAGTMLCSTVRKSDAEMVDRSAADAHCDIRSDGSGSSSVRSQLLNSLEILQKLPHQGELKEPTTYDVAKAMAYPSIKPLDVYRAASCMREGLMREVVQLMIFDGLHAVSPALRLLNIMRGLPGNWELTMELLEAQNIHANTFGMRVMTLIAIQGGRKTYRLCDWGSVLKRALLEKDEEARLAMHMVVEKKWTGNMEYVYPVSDWKDELEYAENPSVWRELEWANFARLRCAEVAAAESSQSPCENYSRPSTVIDQDNFSFLPSEYGVAAKHYVNVCGTLIRRRSPAGHSMSSAVLPREAGLTSGKLMTGTESVVITQKVFRTLQAVANAISYGVPVLLEGSTGCGKTTILSLLARKTLYGVNEDEGGGCGITFVQMDSTMREMDGDSFASLIGSVVPLPEGRGFQWRPGPIGTAVEQGHWLVLENVGSAANRKSSVLSIVSELAQLGPGDTLNAPGRGAPLRVGRGFRCIATRTTINSARDNSWEPPGGWEVWQRVSMEEWSSEDKIKILKGRYPAIEDCIMRVVAATEKVAHYVRDKPSVLVREPTLREAVRICERLKALRDEGTELLTVENALLETVDVLSAWCPVDAQRKPLLTMLSECWSLPADIGNVLHSEHSPSNSCTAAVVRIGRSSMARPQSELPRNAIDLALTGYTLRMLERALRCLQVKEHVLLTGEAGSGKTSLVQELAKLAEKRLIVVNLSRQSEIGDLIGGFRPLELAAAVPQLGKKFEEAFCDSMSRTKNERFLNALQRACCSPDHFPRAIRLMKGAMSSIPSEVRNADSSRRKAWRVISEEIRRLSLLLEPSCKVSDVDISDDSWRALSESMERPRKRQKGKQSSSGSMKEHGTQPKKRPRTSQRTRHVEFQFCEGVLVQAMRAGHWLLLDEINLAPSELLESLVSVLDTGTVTLSNGKGETIIQSPGFKLFGAMNPPTDVGKRPLPAVLRARFTELYAGDMSSQSDIILLILHRCFRISGELNTRGAEVTMERRIAKDVAIFFLQCKKEGAESRLEDAAGKPARFSLRNLCRMLDFASGLGKYVTRAAQRIRRVLYEGAILAFATPLNAESRERVEHLALSVILGDDRKNSIVSQDLTNLLSIQSKPRSSIHSLEGFPVLSKCRPSLTTFPKSSPRFILTPTVRKTLRDVSRALVLGTPRLPVLLQGPTAAGKTSLITHIAGITGNKLTRINNHEHTELSEYIGSYVVTENGSMVFREGPLVQAAREGSWILLDELNLAPPDVLESLNRLLDDNREIFIAETGETVRAVDGFTVFATQNPPGLYGGRKELSRAFRSRFVEVQVPDLPDQELRTILEKRCRIPQSFARNMIAVMRQLQMRRQTSSMFSGKDGFVTARDLFRWASRQPRSKAELAIHGFLLLGERSRRDGDKAVVRTEIVKAIGVDADLLTSKTLYSFEDSSEGEADAKECLDFSLQKLKISRDSLMKAMQSERLVSTPHSRRLLTLMIHAMANSEPGLLVGETGTGKTSCCAVISRAMSSQLITVSCHRHTESSDILGSFRPARKSTSQLFEWVDGPLVQAMKNGYVALIDEINMADDAVVERMNSVLELERTLLLSEKGSVSADSNGGERSLTSEVIKAHQDFRILATMNPSGDFGKRELSPALRNRFTEIWVPAPCTIEEFSPIIRQRLSIENSLSSIVELRQTDEAMHKFLEKSVVSPVVTSKVQGEEEGHGKEGILAAKTHVYLSVRDLTAWCDFIQVASQTLGVSPFLAMLHGARLVFLDGLSVGALKDSTKDLDKSTWEQLVSYVPQSFREAAKGVLQLELHTDGGRSHGSNDSSVAFRFGPFIIPRIDHNGTVSHSKEDVSYSFSSPSTARNCSRLTRAMSGGLRPILLEGPPGCGKTSIIAAIADTAGYSFVRINLSDATEISDLIGIDCPGKEPGEFSFREGPLLSAMRSGSWVLLDELNLASQSVLEGLNSVLDHRRSVYVSEINQEVFAQDTFRVFGAQNPATAGGGRRGLPKSFLNRFTRVQVEAPGEEDILHIVQYSNPLLASETARLLIRCLHQVHKELLGSGYAVDGSSFGLRDSLRWSDLLARLCAGSKKVTQAFEITTEKHGLQIGSCFDIIVLQGLRYGKERLIAEECFKKIFGFTWDIVDGLPLAVPLPDGSKRVGSARILGLGDAFRYQDLRPVSKVLFATQLRELQALCHAANSAWPVVLFPQSPKTSQYACSDAVKTVAGFFGKSVTVVQGGSLTDVDEFIGGYRQKELSRLIQTVLPLAEDLLLKTVGATFGGDFDPASQNTLNHVDSLHDISVDLVSLINAISQKRDSPATTNLQLATRVSEVLDRLRNCSESLEHANRHLGQDGSRIWDLRAQIYELQSRGESEQDAASFEWTKSALVQAIENGEWIIIDSADHCPPAVLDRLNPILERPPVQAAEIKLDEVSRSQKPVVLAEAPPDENGNPVVMKPHSEFRLFLSCSPSGSGIGYNSLSRAILDRSLKVVIGADEHYAVEKNTNRYKQNGEGDNFGNWVRDDELLRYVMKQEVPVSTQSVKIGRYVSALSGMHNNTFMVQSFGLRSRLAKDALIQVPLPSTYDTDFVLHPNLHLINRDLICFRQAVALPMSALAHKHLSITSFLSGANSELLSKVNLKPCSEEESRGFIASSIAEGFVMASQSLQDLFVRKTALGKQMEMTASGVIRNVCHRFINVLDSYLARHASKEEGLNSLNSSFFVVPIDPMYGCDKALMIQLGNTLRDDILCSATARSKLFRLEIIAIQAFRIIWKEATEPCSSGNSRRKSIFSRAKAVLEMEQKGVEVPWDGHIFEILSFGVLSWIAERINSILQMAEEASGWELFGEHHVIRLFSCAYDLCQELMTSTSTKTAVLASRLFEIQNVVRRLRSEFRVYCLDLSMGLPGRFEAHLRQLKHAVNGSRFSLMPRTKEGQELERRLLASAIWERRKDLKDVDVTEYIRAVASLGCSFVESDQKILAVLEQLADRFTHQDIPQSSTTSQVSEWERIISIVSVNRLSSILFSFFLSNTPAQSSESSKKVAFQALKDVISYMKCAPGLSHDSAISVQQASWILEKCLTENDLTDSQSLRHVAQVAMRSSLLNEKAAVLKLCLAADENFSLGSSSEQLHRAQSTFSGERVLSQFWGLSLGRQETTATLSSIAAGHHVLKDFVEDSTLLLQASLQSVTMQLGERLSDNKNVSPCHEQRAVPGSGAEAIDVLKSTNPARAGNEIAILHALAASRIDKVTEGKALQRYGHLKDILQSALSNTWLQTMAWVAVGVLRLLAFQTSMDDMSNVDPSEIARANAQYSYEKGLQASARVLGYALLTRNRLGGDSIDASTPVSRSIGEYEEFINRLKEASERYSYRPESHATYSAFLAMVKTLSSSILNQVRASGLLSLGDSISRIESGIGQREVAEDIYAACVRGCDALCINGAFSHFRDLSATLQLGLREIQLGFAYCLWGNEIRDTLFDPTKLEKFSLVREIGLFPRAAFSGAACISDLLRRCVKNRIPAEVLLTCLKYLVEYETNGSTGDLREVSMAFSVIAQVWKDQSLLKERRDAKDASLHVLVEIARKEETIGNDALEMLEGDQEQDYTNTFNPIPDDLEDELLGLNQQGTNPSQAEDVEKIEKIPEEEIGALDSEAFWRIHERAFPPHGIQESCRDLSDRILQLSELSCHLLSKPGRSIQVLNHVFPTPWDVFHRVADSKFCHDSDIFGKSLTEKEKHRYNFYTDSNPAEILSASSSLKDMYDAIQRIQKGRFGDSGGHPVLAEVSSAINTVAKYCSLSTPLPRVIVGIENILRKVDEWRRLFAEASTKMDSEVSSLMRIVARWRQIEISSWKLLLNSRVQSFETNSTKWFFYLYDVVVHESLSNGLEGQDSKQKIVSSLDLFLRSAPRGEFLSRLRMIKSLGTHILSDKSEERRVYLGYALRSIGQYYSLFEEVVSNDLNSALQVTESKLEDLSRLVSWKADSTFDSAIKMPREKEKYLEYYRLKAASERTKRKLHKLCLEVDASLRTTVYDCLTKDIRQTGFPTLVKEGKTEDLSGNESKPGKSLHCDLERGLSRLHEIVLPSSKFVQRPHLEMRHKFTTGRLGSLPTLEKKLNNIGKELLRASANCDLAQKKSGDLRSAIRARSLSLRESKDAGIQAKKRALVELLKALQTMGLSPYETSTRRIASWSWLATPEPGFCDEYNKIVSSLFFTCVKQVNRLYEVTDSRIRNADITVDEARRARAICSDLLGHACIERKCLHEMFADAITAARLASSVHSSSQEDETNVLSHGMYGKEALKELSVIVRRVRSSHLDLETLRSSLQWSVECAKKDAVDLVAITAKDILLQKQLTENCKTVDTLLAILNRSVDSIKQFLSTPSVKLIETSAGSEFPLDPSLNGTINSVKALLDELSCSVKKDWTSSQEISNDNVVQVTLLPVVEFLQDSIVHFPKERKAFVRPNSETANVIESDLLSTSEQLIETILLGAQNLMTWNHVSKTMSGMFTGEKQVNPQPEKDDILRQAHNDIKTLANLSKLSDVINLLKVLSIGKQSYFSREINENRITEVLDFFSAVSAFAHKYVESFIVPCIRKASLYHGQSIALLRTLSSLFTGLCLEGYCRPAEHAEEGDSDVKDHVGTGFGDAGDDDLSMAQDVSEQIEDEEQLLGLRGDSNEAKTDNNSSTQHDEQKGVEMATDFEGELQDVNNMEDDGEVNSQSDDDRQMSADAGKGDHKVDERLWGGDDTSEENEAEDNPNGESTASGGAVSDLTAREDQKDEEASRKQSQERKEDNNVREDSERDAMDEVAENDQAGNINKGSVSEREPGDNQLQEDNEEEDEGNGAAERKKQDESHAMEKEGSNDVEQGDDNQQGGDDQQDDGNQQTSDDVRRPSNPENDEIPEDTPMAGVEPGDAEMSNQMTDDVRNDGNEAHDELPETLSLGDASEASNEDMPNADAEEDLTSPAPMQSNEVDMSEPMDALDQNDLNREEGNNTNNTDHHNNVTPENNNPSIEGSDMASAQASGRNTTGDKPNELKDRVGTSFQDTHGGESFRGPADVTEALPNPEEEKTADGTDGSAPGFANNLKSDGPQRTTDASDRNEDEVSEDVTKTRWEPNPFRADQQEDLINRWSRYLNVTDESTGEQDKDMSNAQNTGAEWEYKSKDDAQGANDPLALGHATKEQQKPLPPPDGDGNEDIEEESNKSTDPAVKSIEQGQLSNNCAQAMDADPKNSELPTPEKDVELGDALGEEETPLPHAARMAVERLQSESQQSGQENKWNPSHVNVSLNDEATESLDRIVPNEGAGPKGIEESHQVQRREVLNPGDARALWQQLSELTSSSANILCEQLRLILEPNSVSSLTGGFRTGKRLNIRKVIEFVASDFRKDRIWLRRVKPEKRSYDVLLAIDDSESMSESDAGPLAMEALAVVSSAFAKLEIGRMGVASFGSDAKLVRKFEDPLPMSETAGGELLQQFSFSQVETNISNLLELIRMEMSEVGGSMDVEDIKLALVISDGRLSNREEIKQQLRRLKDLNVLVAFIIVDKVGREEASIYNVRRVEYDARGKVQILPYMQDFPVEFHAVVQNVEMLPLALGEALRQWIEVMSNS